MHVCSDPTLAFINIHWDVSNFRIVPKGMLILYNCKTDNLEKNLRVKSITPITRSVYNHVDAAYSCGHHDLVQLR